VGGVFALPRLGLTEEQACRINTFLDPGDAFGVFGKKMKPLPLLQPCSASWQDMGPVAGGRHCAACDKVVFDLSRASEARVLALATLLAPSGLCARQVIDEKGDLELAPSRGSLSTGWAHRAGSALALLSVTGCSTAAGVLPRERAQTLPAAASAAPDCAAQPQAGSVPACPGEPASPAGTRPAAPGPLPGPIHDGDRDGDGVMDREDACPDVPGERPTGCKVSFIRVGGIAPRVGTPMLFERRGAALTEPNQQLLDEVAQVLQKYPHIKLVAVIGHAADDEGPETAARALGLRRAEAVRSALLSRGVQPERLKSASWGLRRPIEPGPNATSRSLNRRVEFHVCNEQPCAALPPE
jgi:outer membrane protein OmpA-like peptidoglycan-associated protein